MKIRVKNCALSFLKRGAVTYSVANNNQFKGFVDVSSKTVGDTMNVILQPSPAEDYNTLIIGVKANTEITFSDVSGVQNLISKALFVGLDDYVIKKTYDIADGNVISPNVDTLLVMYGKQNCTTKITLPYASSLFEDFTKITTSLTPKYVKTSTSTVGSIQSLSFEDNHERYHALLIDVTRGTKYAFAIKGTIGNLCNNVVWLSEDNVILGTLTMNRGTFYSHYNIPNGAENATKMLLNLNEDTDYFVAKPLNLITLD